ncbi:MULTISPECIES: SDR family NAD(P)-dependent oxidoreductase [unclassified Meiothermus]|uniref:SDR family NAD(P)-dependent oxidoreductase n=1 Tax=unclassified Meiothermus TaxID=370471 RepID=UPI000D7C3AC7|nr:MULTISPECIES: SDR family NAD(P)-dependent oxidoreductase [unclassified Meiothermus]PZA07695.1 oxidoreductase [Meiothermus sp. Pnk-1]RYM34493.1 SDR family oxidoreductase [Meiothermus sp. PNK-Is4]
MRLPPSADPKACSARLAGKVAIVTGIGSGIGKSCALMFARHGAQVVGCDLDPATAQATWEEAQAEGLELKSLHPCDLTRPEEARRLVEFTLACFGRLHILVNAAAWAAFKPVEELSYEEWRRTLASELDLVFLLCKAAWPYLKQEGGAIINFASANAYRVLEKSPALAHCAGKGGVLAMTRQLALEGAPFGIRANTISPGLVITGATRPVIADPEIHALWLKEHMLPRFGTPEDVAWAAVFLASDEAGWITAADLAVDGGTRAL